MVIESVIFLISTKVNAPAETQGHLAFMALFETLQAPGCCVLGS